MQITIAEPGLPETAETFTLRLPPPSLTGTYPEVGNCPLCSQRLPCWFADEASAAAMNPDASPINAPCTCAPCLNLLIEDGAVAVTELDPNSF